MVLAFDWETSKKPDFLPWQKNAYAVSLHIAADDGSDPMTWLFEHPEATQPIRQNIQEIQALINQVDLIIAHNAKFDLHWFEYYGIDHSDTPCHCTLTAEYILQNHATRMQDLSLNDLAAQYKLQLKYDKVKEYWDAGYNTDEVPLQTLQEYGEHDAKLALQIYQLQQEKIKERKIETLVRLDMAALKCLQEMEYNGMLLDRELLEKESTQHEMELSALDEYLARVLGIHSISSKEQLSAGLFGGTYKIDGRVPGKRPGTMKNGKIPITIDGVGFVPDPSWANKKEGTYSTAVDVISELKATTAEQKEIKRSLIERSRKDQLQKVYFKGLLARIGEDNYVHCSLNQTTTITSRLSCSNPNLQNIPRGDTGPVKKCFISRYEQKGDSQ